MKSKKYYASQYGGVYVTGEDGTESIVYSYLGDYYKLRVGDESVSRVKRIAAVFAVALAVIFVAMGLLENPATRIMYMSVPYAIMLMPIVFIVADVIRLAFAKREMTEKEYDGGIGQLKMMTWWYFIMACLTVIGTIVYYFGFSPDDFVSDIPFLIGAVAAAAVSFLFIRFQKTSLACDRVVNEARVAAKERGFIDSRWG